MATIIRRDGKKGVSYKIQVAVKDVGLGKTVTKSTTWKPEKGMSEKEIETACTIFADAFEKQVVDSFKTAEDDKGNVNITFRGLGFSLRRYCLFVFWFWVFVLSGRRIL